jgi:hypothetical protein
MTSVGGFTIADQPSSTGWEVVGSYTDYAAVQQAVDRLSDASFPVQNVEIVGRGLRFVEHVTGRVTRARAASAGAVTGAWWGLFIGLLIGLFSSGPTWLGLVLGGLAIGAVWGAVVGFVAHWSLRGRRDFASRAALSAREYDLMVVAGEAARARALLAAG